MYKNYRLFKISINGNPLIAKLEQDELETESPLDYQDKAAPILACWHSRYNLGTKDGQETVAEQVRKSPLYREAWEEEIFYTPTDGHFENKNFMDFMNPQDLANAADKCGFLILPLYLYDHSGITMNTSGFSCPWDSGQVGFIAWSPEARQKWNGKPWKRDSKKRRARDYATMKSIVQSYDQFLTGDIYYISLYDAQGEQGDSIGGIYGHEYATSEQAFVDFFGIDKGSFEELEEHIDIDTAIEDLAESLEQKQYTLPGLEIESFNLTASN